MNWIKQAININLLLLVSLMVIVTSCGEYGRQQQRPSVIIVPSSQNVLLIDPNESFTVNRRSAIIDIGWYIELATLYQEVQTGEWKRVGQ